MMLFDSIWLTLLFLAFGLYVSIVGYKTFRDEGERALTKRELFGFGVISFAVLVVLILVLTTDFGAY